MSNYTKSSYLSLSETAEIMECLCLKEKIYNKGDIIMHLSDQAEDLGLIEYGMAYFVRTDFYGQRSIIDYYEDDDFFGEKLLSVIDVNSYYIIAKEKCKVKFIDFGKLITRCGNECDKHIRFMNKILIRTVRKSQMRIDILSQRSIRMKLLTYFEYLKLENFSNKLTIPLSMSDLADYLSVDRSAMMREIKKMNEDNLIKSNGREIVVAN
ncbi:MAG: Crp/Fnr family transcriptional regulator [Clostridiales bacterium]|nr:Crp/Fnr family transcriptional regulator [Clostridiales bacterium]